MDPRLGRPARLLGLAARLGDFCTLGALESAAYGKDQRRLRLWGVVLAVAISGAFLAEAAGWADLGATFYHSITWVPASTWSSMPVGRCCLRHRYQPW